MMLAMPLSRLAVLLFGLAACEVAAQDLSGQNLAPVQKNALVRTMGLKQGQWHTTVRYEDAAISAVDPAATVPDAMTNGLRAKIGTSVETDDCISYLPSANGGLILPGISIADCDFPDMATGGGHMRLSASCDAGGSGAKTTLDVNATYTPDTMKGSTAIDVVSNGFRIKMKLSSVSSYKGPCQLKR